MPGTIINHTKLKFLDFVKIIFNMDRVYMIIDEMIIDGQVTETCSSRILVPLQLMDAAKWGGHSTRSSTWCAVALKDKTTAANTRHCVHQGQSTVHPSGEQRVCPVKCWSCGPNRLKKYLTISILYICTITSNVYRILWRLFRCVQ